ncbi:NTF2 fold immunity protein [Flavobacterium subsaxonicum]|uniref:NTF2 fold domain-containing protein n=1 Tax=Flavobacterium subsaxonicum WB 4.1-42 = DSM 21790 TaxID=1121898 RepID=A0A0A2MH01_9FLAO|nr:NTF2 fold immunity protein [Flavobacterium subsaxonicum]KGO91952.1 hypothetical protein Q766_15015 [Flavobacterium subsaxonicum WB 4.1-42 = DSM 21790]
MKNSLLLLFCIIAFTACGQSTSNRTVLGLKQAKAELSEALNGKDIHNVVDNKSPIIKDSLTAVAVAEPILFGFYGKQNITKQKPYEVYHIDNYWVLSGTLPEEYIGGTFVIIIDDRNSEVIRITHYK